MLIKSKNKKHSIEEKLQTVELYHYVIDFEAILVIIA